MKLTIDRNTSENPEVITAPPMLAKQYHHLTRLTWGALAVACGLRVWQYALNRSLWMDEANLARNILHRSFTGLLKPLDYHQGAPILFLWLEKLAVLRLGTSEYALRLVPLLAGLFSLFLFYKLATKAISPEALPIAVGLFAVLPALVYYSSEVKQYSSDVAVTVGLYCLVIEGSAGVWKTMRILLLGVAGAAAIWISHASVFVLAGLGATLAVALIARRDWPKLFRLSIAFLMWTFSLGFCYRVALRSLARDNELLSYWQSNFMPLPPRSVSDFKWFVDSFLGIFTGTAGLQFAGLAALVFILGSAYLYSHDRERFFLLVSPAIPTLLASGLDKYPFGGRLALFLLPAVVLLMAEGAERLSAATASRLPLTGPVLIGLLFLDPGIYLLHHFAKPHAEIVHAGVMLPEEIKPAMAYVRSHERSDDEVYVFYGAQPAFEYYAERTGFPESNVVLGTASGDDVKAYRADLEPLRGRRVWILLSHTHGVGAGEARHIMFYLDTVGERLDSFHRTGAATYLYDLTKDGSGIPPR